MSAGWLAAVHTVSVLWAGSVWRACWQGTLLILAAAIACRLFPRLPAGARCWVWWLACLKLLMGLAWVRPMALPVLPAAAPAAPVASAAPVVAPEMAPMGPLTAAPVPSSNARPVAAPALAPSTARLASASRPGRAIPLALLLGLWLGGVGSPLWGVGRQWRTVRQLGRGARPLTEGWIQTQAGELAARLGLRRLPPLRETAAAPGPLVVGLLRPVVLLPEAVGERLSPVELRMALAHIRRGDLRLALVPELAQALFFFHPLVGLAGREWAMAREAACDAAALLAPAAALPDARRRLAVSRASQAIANRIVALQRALIATRVAEMRRAARSPGPVPAQRAAASHPARPAQSVRLEVPAGVELAMMGDGVQARRNARDRRRIEDVLALRLRERGSRGEAVWLRASQARRFTVQVEENPNGASRAILVPPIDTPLELEVPDGVKIEVVGGALFDRGAGHTLRTEGPAMVHLSSGIRLMTRSTPILLAERRAGTGEQTPSSAPPAAPDGLPPGGDRTAPPGFPEGRPPGGDLSAPPGFPEGSVGRNVTEQILLAHLQAGGLLPDLQALPQGLRGVIVFPLKNALIVRGTPAAIAEMKVALAVIDVPLQAGDLVVTLRHGDPAAVRVAALALPRPGRLQVREKTLRFSGRAEWLQRVRGVVFAAELTHPRSVPQGRATGVSLVP